MGVVGDNEGHGDYVNSNVFRANVSKHTNAQTSDITLHSRSTRSVGIFTSVRHDDNHIAMHGHSCMLDVT